MFIVGTIAGLCAAGIAREFLHWFTTPLIYLLIFIPDCLFLIAEFLFAVRLKIFHLSDKSERYRGVEIFQRAGPFPGPEKTMRNKI